MCCTGRCEWEKNDYVNGGTKCLKPLRGRCIEDGEAMEDDDMVGNNYQDCDDDDGEY
jgi:hypothetical protein